MDFLMLTYIVVSLFIEEKEGVSTQACPQLLGCLHRQRDMGTTTTTKKHAQSKDNFTKHQKQVETKS